MEITLITEGTYPFHHGGVSVWCDQLVRDLGEYRFRIVALCATGSELSIWKSPANVVAVDKLPLWASMPERQKRKVQRTCLPACPRFLSSLAIESGGIGFTESLRELGELAQAGELSGTLSSKEAVDLLLAVAPVCSDRSGEAGPGRLSVADAVDVLSLLEHFLRPLASPPPESELCHSVANGLGALPALAAKWSRGTPFLLTEHGLYLRERYLSYGPGTLSQPARAIVLRFFRLLVETAYENADVIAPGSAYNRLWELTNGAEPARIHPVHNGVDPVCFPVATGEPAVPTLSWIGRIDPLKDVETLLRSFHLVRRAVPTCRLRIFGRAHEGQEDYQRRCVKLSAELGLDGAATFEGPVESPLEAYYAGHVVLLTSISEGLPYTVVEAMASGRPVVATNVGGVAEAVGDAGILVSPRNPSETAAACVRLLTDPALRHALGEAARRRVIERFTAERCFAEYRSLYARLTMSRRQRILRLLARPPALPLSSAEPRALSLECAGSS